MRRSGDATSKALVPEPGDRDGGDLWWPLGLWLALRVGMSGWTAWVSSLKPLTTLEQQVPLWLAGAPPGLWLRRVLLEPWLRWDAELYLMIASEGYSAHPVTWQFHPLYPGLARLLALVGLDPLLALLLVSTTASLALAWVFARLASLDLDRDDTHFALLLLLLFPTSFVLSAPYSESLFLLWAVLCFTWMRKGRWALAGLAGGLAALTRQQGLFLWLPLAWEIWITGERSLRGVRRRWRAWLATSLVPLAYSAWVLYRALVLDDRALDLSSLHSTVYSLLISSHAQQVIPGQAFLAPWHALGLALRQVWQAPDLDLVSNLVVAGWFLVLLALAWPKMRGSARLYSAAIALVSFSYHTGDIHPYMGLPRHLLLAFPVFVGVAGRIKQRGERLALAAIDSMGLLWLSMLYVLHAWVP